jgi:hypothetical protein
MIWNVAARLEGLAEPGGICVSARVQEDVRGKLELAFEDLGEQQLENIDRPVRVYRARLNGAAASPRTALSLPDVAPKTARDIRRGPAKGRSARLITAVQSRADHQLARASLLASCDSSGPA